MMTAFDSDVRALTNETRLMMARQIATVAKVLRWCIMVVFSCRVLGSDRANDAQAGTAVQTTS